MEIQVKFIQNTQAMQPNCQYSSGPRGCFISLRSEVDNLAWTGSEHLRLGGGK